MPPSLIQRHFSKLAVKAVQLRLIRHIEWGTLTLSLVSILLYVVLIGGGHFIHSNVFEILKKSDLIWKTAFVSCILHAAVSWSKLYIRDRVEPDFNPVVLSIDRELTGHPDQSTLKDAQSEVNRLRYVMEPVCLSGRNGIKQNIVGALMVASVWIIWRYFFAKL